MRLGLITDIHEDLDNLTSALENLRREAVEQIVLIGDVFEIGHRIAETTLLLEEFQVIGVWGNHDLGLCLDPDPCRETKYGPQTLSYMATLQPRLVLAGCHFSHVYPWLNPYDVADMWYFHGPPDPLSQENVPDMLRCFEETDHQVMFLGHFHRWAVFSDQFCDPWEGKTPLQLNRESRYVIVIDAIAQSGSYAIYDSDTRVLQPFGCSENH